MVVFEQLQSGFARQGGGVYAFVWRRLGFSLVLAAAAAATWALAGSDARYAAEPDLARLIRALAFVKLLFAAPLIWAVWKRLKEPAPAPLIACYATSLAAAVSAAALLAKPAAVGLAPIAFYAGLAGFVIFARRDDGFIEKVLGRNARALR